MDKKKRDDLVEMIETTISDYEYSYGDNKVQMQDMMYNLRYVLELLKDFLEGLREEGLDKQLRDVHEVIDRDMENERDEM